jgi:hypothetical protein
MFDSDGGFGGGTWTQKDNTWVVKFSQVLPDGREASATNIYTVIDANTFTWKSVGRKLDGEFLPNIDESTFVRKGTIQAEYEESRAPKKTPSSSKPEKIVDKSEKPAPTKEKAIPKKAVTSEQKSPEKKPPEKTKASDKPVTK